MARSKHSSVFGIFVNDGVGKNKLERLSLKVFFPLVWALWIRILV